MASRKINKITKILTKNRGRCRRPRFSSLQWRCQKHENIIRIRVGYFMPHTDSGVDALTRKNQHTAWFLTFFHRSPVKGWCEEVALCPTFVPNLNKRATSSRVARACVMPQGLAWIRGNANNFEALIEIISQSFVSFKIDLSIDTPKKISLPIPVGHILVYIYSTGIHCGAGVASESSQACQLKTQFESPAFLCAISWVDLYCWFWGDEKKRGGRRIVYATLRDHDGPHKHW